MPTENANSGVLRPGELLTSTAARRALGVGAWGWRAIAGLIPMVKVGRQKFVLTDDILAVFERLRDEQNVGKDAECSPLPAGHAAAEGQPESRRV